MIRLTRYFSFALMFYLFISCSKMEPEDRNGIAISHLFEGDTTDALKQLNKAIKEKPNFINALMNRAKIYTKQRKYQDALIDYVKILEFDSDNIEALKQKALIWMEMANYEEAIYELTNILDIENTDKHIYYLRGIAYFQLDLNPKACEDWQMALDMGSDEASQEIDQYCSDSTELIEKKDEK